MSEFMVKVNIQWLRRGPASIHHHIIVFTRMHGGERGAP